MEVYRRTSTTKVGSLVAHNLGSENCFADDTEFSSEHQFTVDTELDNKNLFANGMKIGVNRQRIQAIVDLEIVDEN